MSLKLKIIFIFSYETINKEIQKEIKRKNSF